MLQNIREIGIFMIAAQAVVHFAPDRQYEKYIKSISGVIILLLFLKPFVQAAGKEWQTPSAILEQLDASASWPDFTADNVQTSDSGVESAVLSRMEEEIQNRLNRELDTDPYQVKQVELSFEEGAKNMGEETLFSVKVVMGEKKKDNREIAVGKITVGAPQTKEKEALEAYRLRFAEHLGLERERVEVRWDG